MSLREKIEDHLGLVVGGFVVAGFVAGFGAYGAVQAISSDRPSNVGSNWEEMARQEGWVPKGECPAFPISLTISSPGDQAIVDVSPREEYSRLNADLVIRSSYPIAESMDLGVVFNEEGSGNFYVQFPPLQAGETRKVFRSLSDDFVAPFKLSGSGQLNLWSMAVGDQSSVGSIYASLEQIRQSDETVVLSPKVSIQMKENNR
jgi:hypothetical protein